MKKPLFHHIWVELYRMNIWWYRCSRKQYAEMVLRATGQRAPYKGNDVRATFEVYTVNGQDIGIIWFKTRKPVPHECFHAVHWIMTERGIRLSDDSEEAYAYLLDYLINKIIP